LSFLHVSELGLHSSLVPTYKPEAEYSNPTTAIPPSVTTSHVKLKPQPHHHQTQIWIDTGSKHPTFPLKTDVL